MGHTARDVMTPRAECIGENDTVVDAAKKMAELDVGAVRSAPDNGSKMPTDRALEFRSAIR